MKKIVIPALLSAFALYSCGSKSDNNPSNLTGKWQATSIESPTEDSMTNEQMKMYEQQIDALTTVDKDLAAQIKTNNVDSAKAILKSKIAEQKEQLTAEKEKAASGFNIELLSNGTVIQKNENGTDSAKWYTVKVDGTTILLLDPILLDKDGAPMMFRVESVTGEELKLAFHQNKNYKAFITLKKEK